MQNLGTARRRQRHSRWSIRAGALLALAVTPLLACALATLTWRAGLSLATDLAHARSLALAPVSMSQIMSVVAGVGATAIAAHLSLMSIALLAAPRDSRLRKAALRITPHAWRRVVTTATSGVLTAGLALPAMAAPGTSDAGWVPEPIAHPVESAGPHVSHPGSPAPGDSESDQAESARSEDSQSPPESAAPDRDATRAHVVAAGDSLWSITADTLAQGLQDGEPSGEAAAIAEAWPELYDANRDVVGSDPSLIRPGQELTIPAGWER